MVPRPSESMGRRSPGKEPEQLSGLTKPVYARSGQERNRLDRALPPVRPGIREHIAWLEEKLWELDGELNHSLRESPLWRERENLLRSVPGIGPVVTLTLVAELPELGTLNGKQVAALVERTPTWVGPAGRASSNVRLLSPGGGGRPR